MSASESASHSPSPALLSPAELWQAMREDAANLSAGEPVLASFYHANILNHADLPSALAFHLAGKLGDDSVPVLSIRDVFFAAFNDQPDIVDAIAADISAHYERDPACSNHAMPFLYFKGLHSLASQRVANWLWQRDRKGLARFLQNRVASCFDVDIHPAATIGAGIMLDHATGIVIGETAVIGDNVSMLHSVTLGGCGITHGDRHPKVGNGVLIAAGAKVLGNIRIGDNAKIAAGSLVLEDVPACATVAGVPAKIVNRRTEDCPASEMDQGLG